MPLSIYHIATRFDEFNNFTASSSDLLTVYAGYGCV